MKYLRELLKRLQVALLVSLAFIIIIVALIIDLITSKFVVFSVIIYLLYKIFTKL